MPLTPLPSTKQGSPGWAGLSITGTHLRAFHDEPPPSEYVVHFWPSGQSCSQRSHSVGLGPISSIQGKEHVVLSAVSRFVSVEVVSGPVAVDVLEVPVLSPEVVGAGDV